MLNFLKWLILVNNKYKLDLFFWDLVVLFCMIWLNVFWLGRVVSWLVRVFFWMVFKLDWRFLILLFEFFRCFFNLVVCDCILWVVEMSVFIMDVVFLEFFSLVSWLFVLVSVELYVDVFVVVDVIFFIIVFNWSCKWLFILRMVVFVFVLFMKYCL